MRRPIPLALLAAVLLFACTSGNDAGDPPPAPAAPGTVTQGPADPGATPLPEGIVRTDGVYNATMGGVAYVMRFFPDGHVMNTAGMVSDRAGLKPLLVPSTPTDGRSSVHRSPVLIKGDSVLFVTQGMKGEIAYFGLRLGTDSIRFRKYSHINGREATLTYFFEADSSAAQ
ncbi:MAG: hypothetical protein IT228_05525 [Flavobacteriales bacterium]|nr:hypothetical protein [Flavobacteriales bacterium]MCC6576785.1 hypothetical protein [Flavobacteriales bacterium]NUQ16734.1 hypothetical protein [Flavobacteriales bacterium]